MISKNPKTTTLKPQSDRDLAAAEAAGGDRVAGTCSREPSSCDGSWLFPQLCVLGHGHDNRRRSHYHSMSERRRPCMSSSSSSFEKIPDTHIHQNVNGGSKADGGEPPTRRDQKVNFFGNNNGYVVHHPPPPPPVGIIIHDGEEEEVGGGGGINEEGGTVAGRKKRTWTAEEDEKLKRAVEEHGSGNWMIIERCSGLGRTSKSCRLRWTNHLRPNLKKGSFSESEERTVVMLHQKYGNKWSFIASKLPGRTDNEVKNFWHGRLRRCRKQYLDIYPPPPPPPPPAAAIQGDEHKFHLSDQQNHNGGSTISTTDYDYTNHTNISHFSSSTTNDHHQNQNQLHLPINQLPVTSSSPHHHHNSHASLPMINTAQSHHQLHSNIILYQTEPQQPPPPQPLSFSKFSSPEQGSISSSGPSSSSVSSHKLQSTSQLLASSHQVSSQFNSITTSTTTTTRGSPTELAGQQHFLSSRPTNNSPLELKVMTPPPPYHPYFQVNPSSATSSSPVCISPKLEIPVTSPALESLTEMWLNSTMELAKPYTPDFELPQSQSSPSYFNRESSSISNFTPNPELPSFQTPENASLLQVQEPRAKTDLLYPILSEKDDNPDKSLENKIPSAKIFFKNGKTTDNESSFLNPNKRKESFDCEGWETINSSGSQVVKKNLQGRNRMVMDKRLKTEILRGKISRREGLLAEISKTGVLLVEKAKKERLISKLLNQSAKQDMVLSQSPNSNTENLQLGEISKIKDFLSDSLSIEDILTDICNLRDDKSEEEDDGFLAVNPTLLEENHQNHLQETLLDKSSCESVLLTSYEQDEMHDLDVLGIGTQTYGTNLFKPVGGICNDELNSVQVPLGRHHHQVFYEISGRDALPCLGLQGQEQPSMNQLESGGYVGIYEADCLNKSLRTECSENSKKEFAEHEQFQWVGQDDQNPILDESNNWGDDGGYIFGNLQTSVRPDIIIESSCGIPSSSSAAGLVMEGGQRNEILLSRKGSEESSRKRCLGESSIERVHGFQELTLNDFLPVTTTTHQSTTATYDMLGSDAQCSSRGITIEEEDDGHRNIQPEELSSLLEFLPTILPEWNNFSHNTSSTSK